MKEGKGKQRLLIEAVYPVVKNIYEYLEYCKIPSLDMDEPDENGKVRLYCDEKDYGIAHDQMETFMSEENKRNAQKELDNMTEEERQELEEAEKTAPPSNVYVNYESKAEENKTSAWSFSILGVLGSVVVALSWFDMLPFSVGGKGNWFSHSIMFAFFIIFIFIGIISAMNVKKYRKLAEKEADDQNDLEKFLAEKFTLEALSEIEADTEEEAYFKRMKFMRETVAEAMPEIKDNGTFVESLLDTHYDKLFG